MIVWPVVAGWSTRGEEGLAFCAVTTFDAAAAAAADAGAGARAGAGDGVDRGFYFANLECFMKTIGSTFGFSSSVSDKISMACGWSPDSVHHRHRESRTCPSPKSLRHMGLHLEIQTVFNM